MRTAPARPEPAAQRRLRQALEEAAALLVEAAAEGRKGRGDLLRHALALSVDLACRSIERASGLSSAEGSAWLLPDGSTFPDQAVARASAALEPACLEAGGAGLLAGAYEAALEQGLRRKQGSHYTPPELVEVLLDRTLEPLLDRAEGRGAEGGLLSLRVCDPACGAGYILLEAGRRIARRLARARAGGRAPSAAEERAALADVAARCLYGVDLDPAAVALCRLSLRLEAPQASAVSIGQHLQVGDALIGASAEMLARGVPDRAFAPQKGDGPLAERARALSRQNRLARAAQPPPFSPAPEDPLAADALCAAFFWRDEPRPASRKAPPLDHAAFVAVARGGADGRLRERARVVSSRHRFFHWHLAFPEVFSAGRAGFDAVIGNPPWIAHAGRAAQPLSPGARAFFAVTSEAFAGYRSTHGLFVHRAAALLAPGGRLGLVLPTSVADLGGYVSARTAHDRLCQPDEPLHDFGDGAFEGVFQPCMALVSERKHGGRSSAGWGQVWELARHDLGPAERGLLERLFRLPRLPAWLFGERGIQSTGATRALFREAPGPSGEHTVPVREGVDVREMQLLAPRLWLRPSDLAVAARPSSSFAEVGLLVRQTARYPIAALSDGAPFRNSLLACFPREPWTAGLLLGLLASRLVRFHHHQAFRDARQGMPQVKIAHLRAIPAPPSLSPEAAARIEQIALAASSRNQGLSADERRELDQLVELAYQITADERGALDRWQLPR